MPVRDAAACFAVESMRDQGWAMRCTVDDAEALISLGPQPHHRAGAPVGTILLASRD